MLSADGAEEFGLLKSHFLFCLTMFYHNNGPNCLPHTHDFKGISR